MCFRRVLTFSVIALAVFLVFMNFHIYPALGHAENEAKTAIEEAESEILNCYVAVYEAEKASANVSEPLAILNEAGWLLSQAKQAYNTMDFGSAFAFANESRTKLNGFVNWVDTLKRNAEQSRNWNFMVNFVGSSVGAVCVVVGGFAVWTFLKKREQVGVNAHLSIKGYGLLYWVAVGLLSLLVASPFLSRVLVYPQTEFFTELWILDANHKAENYPHDITRNQNYTVCLGISNHLGYCACYTVQVKFRNQTQPAPTSFGSIENRLPSTLPSLFNITVFVSDGQVYEFPITFSFDYVWNEQPSRVELSGLRLNNVWLNMSGYTIFWDAEKQGFRGFLFFELWLYNGSASVFQYHGRFVGLWLNMTVH